MKRAQLKYQAKDSGYLHGLISFNTKKLSTLRKENKQLKLEISERSRLLKQIHSKSTQQLENNDLKALILLEKERFVELT